VSDQIFDSALSRPWALMKEVMLQIQIAPEVLPPPLRPSREGILPPERKKVLVWYKISGNVDLSVCIGWIESTDIQYFGSDIHQKWIWRTDYYSEGHDQIYGDVLFWTDIPEIRFGRLI
jgi:hypothetical protein